MLDLKNIQDLEEIINTTWGKSSTVKNPSRSITSKITGPDTVLIKLVMIVNLGNNKQLKDAKERHEDEARQVVNDYIKNVKSEYKEKTGQALKMKLDKYDTSIEVIQMSAYSPKMVAYFRFNGFAKVE